MKGTGARLTQLEQAARRRSAKSGPPRTDGMTQDEALVASAPWVLSHRQLSAEEQDFWEMELPAARERLAKGESR